MLLGHGVRQGDVVIVLNALDGDGVIGIRFLGFRRWECDAAAADQRLACGAEDIAAEGADVEFRAEDIGGGVFIGHGLDQGDIGESVLLLMQRLSAGSAWVMPFCSRRRRIAAPVTYVSMQFLLLQYAAHAAVCIIPSAARYGNLLCAEWGYGGNFFEIAAGVLLFGGFRGMIYYILYQGAQL